MLLERLGRLVAARPEPLARDREPGAALLDEAALAGEIDELVRARDSDAVEDVELGLAERRRELVLHHLHARARADDQIAVLHRADAANVEPHRAVELEGVAARGGLGRAENDADLHPDLVDEDDARA